MKSIKEIKSLSGKRVLLRVDFNVPIENNKVVDDFRIKKAVPTIKYLHSKGAIIILISHLGKDGEESLKPVFKSLKKYFPTASFIDESILGYGATGELDNLEKGDIVLMKNLRGDEGEKKNLPSFARGLSRYADIYVNDAFSVCHRAHASIVGLPKHLPSYAGLQLLEEIKNISNIFKPKHPFLFILGGAKFETKIPLVKKYLHLAEEVFIGGAIANDFLKARGYGVGISKVDNKNLPISSLLKRKNLILPTDVEVTKGKKNRFSGVEDIDTNESIVDMGPNTIKDIEKLIKKAKLILWNGPLGKYEDGYSKSTESLLKAVAKSKAYSVIGGGDTVSLVSKLKLESKFNFVSTGGGAMLEFLTKETLPGIKALK